MIERFEGHDHEGAVLRTLCRRILDWEVKISLRMRLILLVSLLMLTA